MINSNNKLDVTLDFENVDMNDVNVYVAFKNNGKLVGMKMPQASELKGIDLIDKEYTDIEVYAWDNKQKPYANIVRIVMWKHISFFCYLIKLVFHNISSLINRLYRKRPLQFAQE